jgi:hypothetical protein
MGREGRKASWCRRDPRRGRREGFAIVIRPIPSGLNGAPHLLSGSGLRNCQRHTEDSICTELSLVWSSIKLDQELINLWLILDIDVLLDESGTNDLVDVCNSLKNTLSSPLGLITIAEFDCLVLACGPKSALCYVTIKPKVRTGGSAGWNDSAMETSFGDNVNLDGWVTTRIVDGSSVDLGNCHDGFSMAG